MAASDETGIGMPPAHEVLITEGDAVSIEAVDPRLVLFAVQLGYLHYILFAAPLVITRAGLHVPAGQTVPGPVHFLHFHIVDLAGDERLCFLNIVQFAADHNGCTVAVVPGATPSGELRVELWG